MDCPYCNNEMVKGYLHGGAQIYFSRKARLFKNIPHKGDVYVRNGLEHVGVYKCKICKKLIFDCNERNKEEIPRKLR